MIVDALRFMRAPNLRDDELTGRVRETFERLEAFIRPRSVWGRFPVGMSGPFLRLGEVEIQSVDLRTLLVGSWECCLMAVTLGPEVDRQILRAQKRDMVEGLMLDACASVLADTACDELCERIEREIEQADGEKNEKGIEAESTENPAGDGPLHLTRRFSPGYGDVPLEASRDIILALDATRRIGLSLTRSLMMTPVKSITAIAGITREKQNWPTGCASCQEDCPYKKASP